MTLCIVAFAILLPSAAFAADPFPVCQDKDHDGYAVCDSTCTISGTSLKCGDCSDGPGYGDVHPGATEIWGDGIDNDCKVDPWDVQSGATKGDRVSLGAEVLARFEHGLQMSIPAKSSKELKLLKNIMACKAAGANCKLDYNEGTFAAAAGYQLVDVDCDGVINVVKEDYSLTIKDQEACRKAARPAPSVCRSRSTSFASVPLPGAATPTTKAPAKAGLSAKQLDQLNVAIAMSAEAKAESAQASVKADKALVAAGEAKDLATKASAKVDTFDAVVAGHTAQLSTLDQALKAEEARAKAAEAAIDTKAQTALDRATEGQRDIEKLQSAGFFIEGYLGGGIIGQRDFEVRKNGVTYVARKSYAPTLELGGNAGLEMASGRFNLFGALSPSWDNGESALGGTAGLEHTWRLGDSNHFLGVNGMYQRHNSGGNVVVSKAVGNGFGGGLTYVLTSADQAHVGIQARLDVMYEDFGTDAQRIDVQSGPSVRFMIDLLGGFSLGRK